MPQDGNDYDSCTVWQYLPIMNMDTCTKGVQTKLNFFAVTVLLGNKEKTYQIISAKAKRPHFRGQRSVPDCGGMGLSQAAESHLGICLHCNIRAE